MIVKKHSLGQVFLKDQSYIEKILNCIDQNAKKIVEIGPGTGQITGSLVKQTKFLYCIEIDSRLCSFLKDKFSTLPQIKIIQSDILKFKLSELGKKITIFGNVPYYISSQLIDYLIYYRKYIQRVYLTLQKEFVQKLIAKKGSNQYGFLSCFIQYYAKVEKIFNIPAGAFEPHPKVDSSFITFEFYQKPPYKAKNEEFLFELIRKAFLNRRKKISNTVDVVANKEDFFSKLGVDSALRPQDISLKEYITIANKLYSFRKK